MNATRPASRRLLVPALAAAALAVLAACNRSPADSEILATVTPPRPAPPPEPPPAPRPVTPLPVLAPDIPFDVTVKEPQPTLESLQHDFDVLSWQTFIAMNWPVLPDGQPDRSQVPGHQGDNDTVWETWKKSSEIFLPDGAPPAPWGAPVAPAELPAALRELPPGTRILTQVGKTPGLLTESIQPFNTGPLVDQNGRYARFEILVNRPMFDTIVAQKLYSKKAQATVQSVVFPCGTNAQPAPGVGAIVVKAAWKILSPSEVASGRFHAVPAVIYTPASVTPPISEKTERATVGLVGLHVVHKTASSPQWVWSTFEHVDNCPTAGEPVDRAAYNFYNKATPEAPANRPPPRPWDPTVTEPPGRRPQLVRQIPIDAATRVLNASYQASLRAVNPASVWQYYELVSTQWPTAPAPGCDVAATAPANLSGAPAPQFLGNSTLESYIQGRVPNVSSSCIECHLNATTTTHVFSDFTYLLERAR